jgi:hypothetical protein
MRPRTAAILGRSNAVFVAVGEQHKEDLHPVKRYNLPFARHVRDIGVAGKPFALFGKVPTIHLTFSSRWRKCADGGQWDIRAVFLERTAAIECR